MADEAYCVSITDIPRTKGIFLCVSSPFGRPNTQIFQMNFSVFAWHHGDSLVGSNGDAIKMQFDILGIPWLILQLSVQQSKENEMREHRSTNMYL
jgi:hypothetical protein